jgi:hypothetical protein
MRYIRGRHDGRAAITTVSIIDAARYREHKQSKKPILKGVKHYSASINNDGDQHALENEITKVDKNHIFSQPLTGGEMLGGTSFDVLLGMDIISTGELHFSKYGTYSFHFD